MAHADIFDWAHEWPTPRCFDHKKCAPVPALALARAALAKAACV
jgi:hypothetical protein